MFERIVAEFYDEVVNAGYHNQKKYIDDLVSIIPKGSKVLELGCGTGQIMIPLIDQGILCEGVDSSKYMIEKLKSKKGDSVCYNTDIRMFSSKEEYDFVFSCHGPFTVKDNELESYIQEEGGLSSCLRKYSQMSKNGLFISKSTEKDGLRIKLGKNREFVHREMRDGDLMIMVHLLLEDGKYKGDVVDVKRRYLLDGLLKDADLTDRGQFLQVRFNK